MATLLLVAFSKSEERAERPSAFYYRYCETCLSKKRSQMRSTKMYHRAVAEITTFLYHNDINLFKDTQCVKVNLQHWVTMNWNIFSWSFVWKQDTVRCIATWRRHQADSSTLIECQNQVRHHDGCGSERLGTFACRSLISLSNNCVWECFFECCQPEHCASDFGLIRLLIRVRIGTHLVK